MTMKASKKHHYVIIISLMSCCLILLLLGKDIKCVSSGIHQESVSRLMRLIFEAKKQENFHLLNDVTTPEILLSLNEIEPLFDMGFEVAPLDFLETQYNYRLTFDNGMYFSFWVETQEELNLGDLDTSSDEYVLSQLRILRMGAVHLPDYIVERFIEGIFNYVENDATDALKVVVAEEGIVTLYNLQPYYKRVYNISGLDSSDGYNYRVGINKSKYYYMDIILVWSPDIQSSNSISLARDNFANEIYLKEIVPRFFSEDELSTD